MIAIIDYGYGNIKAITNMYHRLQIPFYIAHEPNDLARAKKIILPGVGAFDHAMGQLNQSGMRSALEQHVLEYKVPILGICVGMQILAHSSEEGCLPGLGWISGQVKQFEGSKTAQPNILPHMGWNSIEVVSKHALLKNIANHSRYYFLHSYYFICDQPTHVLASTSYSTSFASIIGHENIFGAQFHPEKSHDMGIQLLKNFAELSLC